MIDQHIRQLAARKESQNPFLTLYLDTARSDEMQRDRLRVHLKDELRKIREALGGNGNSEMVERGIREIEQYMENSLESNTRGLAIFSCPAEQFFLPIQLPVQVQQNVTIGSRPHIKPLAELRHEYPTVALAMIDGKFARLFVLEFGRSLQEIDLEHPDMPRRHDQGGWSQANMQRHVQDHVDRHHKEVADVLTKLAGSGALGGIIVSGQERNIANFRGFLAKKVDESVIATLHLDMHTPVDEIVAACQDAIRKRRISTLMSRLEAVESAAQKRGRGAVGFDAVIDAVNQRKVEHLYLTRAAQCRGWKCTECGMIGKTMPLGCPICGNRVVTTDVVDELISGTNMEHALIEFVDGASPLDRYDGVGALLRF